MDKEELLTIHSTLRQNNEKIDEVNAEVRS